MNKKNILGITLAFAVIHIYRSIGIENIPFGITVSIMIFCLLIMVHEVFRHKGDKKERAYLKVMTSLIGSLIFLTVIWLILDNYYPILSKKYNSLTLVLTIILFISVLVATCINAVVVIKNKRNSK